MDNRVEIRPGRTINITVYSNPNAKATAFLLHGLGGRGEQWRYQIAALKDYYTLIVPDMLGHGKSDKPTAGDTNPYTFTEYDRDLHVIFDRYASENNIILGHSYGGTLATSLALDHQDKVNELILIAPKPCVPNRQIPWTFTLPVFVLELMRPWLDQQFQQLGFGPFTSPELRAEEMQAAKQNSMSVIKAVIHGLHTIPDIDVTMLTVPTFIIMGNLDGIVPIALQLQYFNGIRHHQFELIENASHMVLLEMPERVNKLILGYLETMDSTGDKV